jgi:hypothetical protein
MRDRRFIPLHVHQAIEPVAAALFILAPFVLGFDESSAKRVSIAFGLIVVVLGLTTDWRMAVMRLIPLRGHFLADLALGIVAIASPFVLGFSGDAEATVFLIVMGVGELGAALGTDWASDEAAERRDARPRVHMPMR